MKGYKFVKTLANASIMWYIQEKGVYTNFLYRLFIQSVYTRCLSIQRVYTRCLLIKFCFSLRIGNRPRAKAGGRISLFGHLKFVPKKLK